MFIHDTMIRNGSIQHFFKNSLNHKMCTTQINIHHNSVQLSYRFKQNKIQNNSQKIVIVHTQKPEGLIILTNPSLLLRNRFQLTRFYKNFINIFLEPNIFQVPILRIRKIYRFIKPRISVQSRAQKQSVSAFTNETQ